MNSKRWSSTTKIIVTALLVLLAVVLLIAFRAMIRPTIIAFLLTFVLYQPVNQIQRRTGWSRAASVISVYILLVILLTAAPVFFLPRLASSLNSLVVLLDTLVADLQTADPGPLLALGAFELSPNSLLQQIGAVLQDVMSPVAAGALGFALTLTTSVLTIIYVLVLGFWLLKDMSQVERAVLNVVPLDYREDIRRLGNELASIWHAFLRGQLVLGLVVGIMTWVVMSLLGLPNAAGLALLAGVMEFLPTVGPGISGAIGTLVALFQGSTWMPVNNFVFAFIVMIFYIIITQIESVYLIPRLVGRRVHLHPAVTFAGIISAAVAFGVLGVLLITPTIASVRTILVYVLRKLRDQEPFAPTFSRSDVRIPGLIAGHRIETVIFDLDGTLAELDLSLADEAAERLQSLERVWSQPARRAFFRRLLVLLEGPIYRLIGFLSWLQLHDDVERMMPFLNRARGFPQLDELCMRPGVQRTLTDLSASYKIGLVTTRSRKDLQSLFERGALPAEIFDATVTRDEIHPLAPFNEALSLVLEKLEKEPDAAMVVADSELRLRPGQSVGSVQAGVLWGMGDARDFENADIVLESPLQLIDWL